MKNKLMFIAWLLSSLMTHTLFAQSKIEDILQNLDKKLVSVEVGKEKTDPSVASSLAMTGSDKKSPCTVVFSIEDTDAKGKSETSSYEIGLSDLSPQLLKAVTKGNIRLVEVATKDRSEFIKFTKNGEFKDYVAKFTLPAYDNDAAKDIIDLLKAAVETCEKMASDACPKPTTFSDATNQLKTLIGKIIINENQIEQELSFDKTIATRAVLTVRESGKSKTIERTYAFDFADFADNKVKFTVSSKQLKVNVFSRNGDLIQRMQDGKCQSNENDLMFLAANIEQAKCLVKTLQNALAIARDEADKRLPDNDYKLRLSIETFKGKTTEEVTYEFNFKGIDARRIELKISGKEVSVVLPTKNNEKIIKENKKDKTAYENGITIKVEDIESGRDLLQTLQKVVD
jgi:hypothetical protein